MLLLVALALGRLSDTAALIVVVTAALVAIGTWVKWVGPRARATRQDLRAFRDAILGREAILHPDTGEVLADAVPGIGARMAASDDRLDRLTGVVETIAASHGRLDAFEIRLSVVEQAIGGERVLKGIESVQLLRTMEAVAKGEPHDDDPEPPSA